MLVKVVNPQSFHWTMDLLLPWPRLAALCAAVVAAGTADRLARGARARSAAQMRAGGQGRLVSVSWRSLWSTFNCSDMRPYSVPR